MDCLAGCYKYKVRYNANFWGSQKASGYVFADDMDDAKSILEKKYGKPDWSDINNSTIVGFDISPTNIIQIE